MPLSSSNNAVNSRTNDTVLQDNGDEHAIDNFIQAYPLSSMSSAEPAQTRRLSAPVVIPQRRPGNKSRGFMEVYAPTLSQFGIRQDEFVDFIKAANKAVRASKWVVAVMLAAAGAGVVPNPIAMGISVGVQIAAGILARAQMRWKTNSLLDRVNAEYFQPRGLYCLLMAYTPLTRGGEADFNVGAAISSHDVSSTSQDENLAKRAKKNLRNPVAGKVEGAESLPTNVAPLVYPNASTEKDESQTSSKGRIAIGKLASYVDDRAQARYANESSGDVLSQPCPPSFKNRYLDPNHPATNGGLLGLVSGGRLTPNMEKMNQRYQSSLQAQNQALKEQQSATMEQLKLMNLPPEQEEALIKQYEDAFQLQEQQTLRQADLFNNKTGAIRTILNVSYLMIVEMPSDEQIAMAQQTSEIPDYQQLGPDLGMKTVEI